MKLDEESVIDVVGFVKYVLLDLIHSFSGTCLSRNKMCTSCVKCFRGNSDTV